MAVGLVRRKIWKRAMRRLSMVANSCPEEADCSHLAARDVSFRGARCLHWPRLSFHHAQFSHKILPLSRDLSTSAFPGRHDSHPTKFPATLKSPTYNHAQN